MEKLYTKLEEISRLLLLQTKEALNMEEAAMLTGYSKEHLYRLVCKKKIPYYKSDGGRYTFFKKAELESWLLAHRVNTMAEAEQAVLEHMGKGGKK